MIYSLESLATDGAIARFLTALPLGVLTLVVAGRKLVLLARPSMSPMDRGTALTMTTISIGLAVAALSVGWRAFSEPIPVAVQVLFIIGGTGFLYGSFGGLVGVVARRPVRKE